MPGRKKVPTAIRRVARYWWLLALLLVAGYFALIAPKDSTYRKADTAFAIDDTTAVTRVIITDPRGSVALVKTDTGWVCNGKARARREGVQSLLAMLAKLSAKSPVPLSVADSLRNEMERNSVQIQVYGRRYPTHSVSLYHTETLNLQTIGRLKGSSNLFQVEIPSIGSDFMAIFATNEDYWVDVRRRFVNMNEVFAIEVEIPAEPQKSFRIDFQEPSNPRLFALYFGKALETFNAERLQRYMQALISVSFSPRTPSVTDAEAAQARFTEPDFIVTLYSRGNRHARYSFIPIPVEEYMDELGRPVQFDLNRMYMTVEGSSNIYEVRFIDFAPILKDISYFTAK